MSGSRSLWLNLHQHLCINLVSDFGKAQLGANALGISTYGDYILDTTAHGPWTVDITQPRPQTAQSVPFSFSGKGQQVSQFFTLTPGLARFRMTHDGERDFIVWLLDSKGNKVELWQRRLAHLMDLRQRHPRQ
jgi:hypothetical protein